MARVPTGAAPALALAMLAALFAMLAASDLIPRAHATAALETGEYRIVTGRRNLEKSLRTPSDLVLRRQGGQGHVLNAYHLAMLRYLGDAGRSVLRLSVNVTWPGSVPTWPWSTKAPVDHVVAIVLVPEVSYCAGDDSLADSSANSKYGRQRPQATERIKMYQNWLTAAKLYSHVAPRDLIVLPVRGKTELAGAGISQRKVELDLEAYIPPNEQNGTLCLEAVAELLQSTAQGQSHWFSSGATPFNLAWNRRPDVTGEWQDPNVMYELHLLVWSPERSAFSLTRQLVATWKTWSPHGRTSEVIESPVRIVRPAASREMLSATHAHARLMSEKSNVEARDWECAICTNDLWSDPPLAADAPVARAVCGHYFHEGCLCKWRTSGQGSSHVCPICRAILE